MTKENEKVFNNQEILNELRITTIHKDTPLYIEIYRRLRKLIKSNVLQYGEQLPGEIELARIMDVGRTSLRTALTILYEDGYIKTLRGKGSYVAYDSRKEKSKGMNPMGIVLPVERISFLGELSRGVGLLKTIEGDDFLTEKLSPEESKIMLFSRLYLLNEKPAIFSNYYFCSNLFEIEKTADMEEIENRLVEAIQNKSSAVECEFISVPPVSFSVAEHHILFKGENHVLVSSTYIDDKSRVVAYCKDYYNDGVIRFRTTIKK